MNFHTSHAQGRKMLVKTVFSILSLLLLGGVVPNSSIAQENRPPVFTENTLDNLVIVSVPENTTPGKKISTPFSATDPNGDRLTYSLGGPDAASFRIGKKTGQLRTREPLDYETKNTYFLTITASDGNGGEATLIVTIAVQGNRPPVFTAGNTLIVSVPENTTPGEKISTLIVATDADGDPLRYSLGGPDAASFRIGKKTGQLRTHTPLNLENPLSLHTYFLTITASDGNGGEASINVTINVTKTPDAPGAPARQAPPAENALLANYPNPFNPETWIPYQLAKDSEVSIRIYDTTGRVVRTLQLGHQAAGFYTDRSRSAYWDGRNALGEPVASGVYFYTLTAGDFTATRKLLIRK